MSNNVQERDNIQTDISDVCQLDEFEDLSDLEEGLFNNFVLTSMSDICQLDGLEDFTSSDKLLSKF